MILLEYIFHIFIFTSNLFCVEHHEDAGVTKDCLSKERLRALLGREARQKPWLLLTEHYRVNWVISLMSAYCLIFWNLLKWLPFKLWSDISHLTTMAQSAFIYQWMQGYTTSIIILENCQQILINKYCFFFFFEALFHSFCPK